jgi:glycosyltransferase involved in cell wall biosynthesis
MKILFITIAFAPDEFSESIVNSKLVLAFKKAGHQVDVISRREFGPTYSSFWNEPWSSLRNDTTQINYDLGSKWRRFLDIIKCSIQFKYPLDGIRWIKRAFYMAEEMLKQKKYDIIITRSPSDIPHIVGLYIKEKHNIPWVANWNDPASGIWPHPYKDKSSLISKRISSYYTRKILQKADFNTFPSARLRNHFLRYYDFNLDNSEIIPHIGLALIDNYNFEINNQELSICHAGNLSEERNPEVLFKSIARLKKETRYSDIKFAIVGVVSPGIKIMIENYSLQDEVSIIESKPYLETMELMQEFDLLCVIEAKMDEGIFLPSKIADYAILKKPVLCISPKEGTLADLIERFGGGMVLDNASDDEVYTGINDLINYKKTNSLNEHFDINKLSTLFSCEVIIKKYEDTFQRIKFKQYK